MNPPEGTTVIIEHTHTNTHAYYASLLLYCKPGGFPNNDVPWTIPLLRLSLINMFSEHNSFLPIQGKGAINPGVKSTSSVSSYTLSVHN